MLLNGHSKPVYPQDNNPSIGILVFPAYLSIFNIMNPLHLLLRQCFVVYIQWK